MYRGIREDRWREAATPPEARLVHSDEAQVEGRTRDLALFNIAIDSKLRGCDIAALKVDDVAPSGYAADRASVRQKKTGRPGKFELTEATRQAIDDYLRATGKKAGDRLFTGRRGPDLGLTTRQCARLLSS